MAKEKVELLNELKNGISQFTLVGKASVKADSLKGALVKEGKTWFHVDSSFGVDTGEKNIVYGRIWDGYVLTKASVNRNSKSFEDGRFDIPWEDRFNEEIIEKVSGRDLYYAGLERDENGKIITKKFISGIDFEEYLSEHLSDGAKVRVRGDVEYSPYEDKVSKRYSIKAVYLAEDYEKDGETISQKEEATIRQTYILTEDSLARGWEKELDKDGRTIVSAKVPQYLSQIKSGDKYVPYKKTTPLTQAIIIEAGAEGKEASRKKIIEKFFKVKKEKVREIVLDVSINEGYSQSTGVEINAEMRELIELGVFSEEDIEKQVTIRGSKVSELIYMNPALKMEEGAQPTVMVDDAKYSMDALIIPKIPTVDGVDDTKVDNYFEDDKGTEKTLDDDAFAAMFGAD